VLETQVHFRSVAEQTNFTAGLLNPG